MGHTNSTTNYHLPQFVTTDKPAWLTDINGAFGDIDTGLNTAQSDATTAKTNAAQAILDASAASTAASTADAKGAGAVASIADTFDSTATYAVDDLVMYNSLLYKCTTAVTTPGPWTGTTNWTRATIEGLVPVNADQLPLGTASTPGSTASAIAGKINTSGFSTELYSGSAAQATGDQISLSDAVTNYVLILVRLSSPSNDMVYALVHANEPNNVFVTLGATGTDGQSSYPLPYNSTMVFKLNGTKINIVRLNFNDVGYKLKIVNVYGIVKK